MNIHTYMYMHVLETIERLLYDMPKEPPAAWQRCQATSVGERWDGLSGSRGLCIATPSGGGGHTPSGKGGAGASPQQRKYSGIHLTG